MKEPSLKQLKKAAPRARVLHNDTRATGEHELEFLEPGLYGPESLTARCACLLYSVTAMGPVEAREALRKRAPTEFALHVRERVEFDAMIEALPRQAVVGNVKLDARDVHTPGGSGGRADRTPRAPFPVEYVHIDGASATMPRGYTRAHAEAARREVVAHG